MRPSNTSFNTTNGSLLNTELLGYLGLSYALLKHFAYLANLLFGKLGNTVAFTARRFFGLSEFTVSATNGKQTKLQSVSAVSFAGRVFKIIKAVISFNTVNVVHFHSQWTSTKKRLGDKFMNALGKAAFSDSQNDSQIAFLVRESGQKLVGLMSEYSTKIGNGIKSFKSNNGTPFFGLFAGSVKMRDSHSFNLLDRFKLWRGSLSVDSTYTSRFYYTTGGIN